ncbi:hypothetical protein PVAG01_08348 [Phlyctema vagabunda]|uniref:Uncharacterized protein n=1 Tax=Phlyctema vagabunda TaxID=108571 RepID=A0ABR4P990_9HELO
MAAEKITLSGYTIPSGTIVQPWAAYTLLDENIQLAAQRFVPERWSGLHKGVTVDRKAFLLFSAGSCNGIGQQYALRELRIILANVCRRFELFLVPGQSHKRVAMLTPHFVSGQYLVTLRPQPQGGYGVREAQIVNGDAHGLSSADHFMEELDTISGPYVRTDRIANDAVKMNQTILKGANVQEDAMCEMRALYYAPVLYDIVGTRVLSFAELAELPTRPDQTRPEDCDPLHFISA